MSHTMSFFAAQNKVICPRDARIRHQKACNLHFLQSVFMNSVHCFRQEEIQIYKHLALTVNNIRISREITANIENCMHLLHKPDTEAKLNHS